MPKRLLPALIILGLFAGLLLLAARPAKKAAVPVVSAAPNVFSGPVNGGCYLDTVTTCQIHIDNWQPILTDAGAVLNGFRLVGVQDGSASGAVLYDFRTDVSNPPSGSYLPSLVKKDFSAQCGTTYHLSLLAKDSGDLDFEEVGRTAQFQCPAAPTPTPSPTSTPSPTPTPSPTATPSPIATTSPTATPASIYTPSPIPTSSPERQLYLPIILRD
jgi:hypothetical protein